MQGEAVARRRGLILVSIATALWSSAGLFARALDHLDVWTVLAGRGAFGALFMFCASIVEWRRGELGPRFGLGSKLAPLIVLFAAGAMTAYIAVLRLTSVAEVMAIYATVPFVTAGLAFVLVGERIPRRTLAAAGLALVGVLVMVGGDVGAGQLAGQALSFGMTICFALMVVAQRRHREMSLTSINALGALVSAIAAFSLAPPERVEMPDLFTLAVFGLTTICVAFLMFMKGAKNIPAAESALISVAEVVLGPLWVFFVFGENPGLPAIVGGALVLIAVGWRMAPERAARATAR